MCRFSSNPWPQPIHHVRETTSQTRTTHKKKIYRCIDWLVKLYTLQSQAHNHSSSSPSLQFALNRFCLKIFFYCIFIHFLIATHTHAWKVNQEGRGNSINTVFSPISQNTWNYSCVAVLAISSLLHYARFTL